MQLANVKGEVEKTSQRTREFRWRDSIGTGTGALSYSFFSFYDEVKVKPDG